MILMDGKSIAAERFDLLKERMEREGRSSSLCIIKVGENIVSETYISAKKKALHKAGIDVRVRRFPEEVSEEDLGKEIRSAKEEGAIVQLPLPKNLQEGEVLNSIPPEKDVDMLSVVSCGEFYCGSSLHLPPVVGAVKILLEEYEVHPLQEKKVALLGAGKLVGKPLSVFLMKEEATVLVLNEHTRDIGSLVSDCDVVVSGTGVPSLIKGDIIKEGAVVIDAGTGVAKNEVRGDVDTESVKKKASLLAPVPGGVGPLTAYVLACNLLGYEY